MLISNNSVNPSFAHSHKCKARLIWRSSYYIQLGKQTQNTGKRMSSLWGHAETLISLNSHIVIKHLMTIKCQ